MSPHEADAIKMGPETISEFLNQFPNDVYGQITLEVLFELLLTQNFPKGKNAESLPLSNET